MQRLCFACVVIFGACAAQPTDDVAGGSAGGKADGQEPLIEFRGDYSQHVTGTLLAGSPVRIRYSLDRVTECKAESNNSEVWGVTGWAQFDGGTPVSFEASRLVGGAVKPVDTDLDLPASAEHVAIWFQVTNRWGCTSYDSNYGSNYEFDIDRHGLGAVVAFETDWSVTQSEAIHAGDQVVVHYQPDRLSQCAGSTMGHPAWAVTLHWQADGGDVHDASASKPADSFLVAGDPVITVPRSHDLAMWFEATSVWGCHAYDSAYGANYHFTVE